MAETHEHTFTTLKLFKVIVCDNDNYTGRPGDFAFITKACECGKVQPHDYGRTHLMQEKYKKLQQEVQDEV